MAWEGVASHVGEDVEGVGSHVGEDVFILSKEGKMLKKLKKKKKK